MVVRPVQLLVQLDDQTLEEGRELSLQLGVVGLAGLLQHKDTVRMSERYMCVCLAGRVRLDMGLSKQNDGNISLFYLGLKWG